MDLILERIKSESEGDTRQYLTNCHNNYIEYVNAAKILFPYYYENIERLSVIDKEYEKAISFRKNGDLQSELEILQSMIIRGCPAPGIYRRAAHIFIKIKHFETAKETILKWFETEYWKVPNMAVGSLKLLDMLERLENNNDNEL